MKTNRKKLYRGSYFLSTILDFILLIGVLIFFISIIPKNIVNAKTLNYEEYVVEKGDTLWSIATDNKKPGQDVREYIYNIQELNNINSSIYPGQILKIIK